MNTSRGRIVFFLLLIWVLLQLDYRHLHAPAPPPDRPTPTDPGHQEVTLDLKRGGMLILHYPAKHDASRPVPKAVILFESGGGGWCWWEDKLCTRLQKEGYEVVGIDARLYSLSDYDVDILQHDFQTLAQYGMKRYGGSLPLIIGGWSTGAEQAVAAGGGPHPPDHLAGLLLIAPGSWGGYGWFTAHDYGPRLSKKGTFALADFAPSLTRVRIVQWHADLDMLDSRSWLHSLQGPCREYDLSNSIHDFGGVSDEFLAGLGQSLDWILDPHAQPVAPVQIGANQ
jgi:hypothetical protein